MLKKDILYYLLIGLLYVKKMNTFKFKTDIKCSDYLEKVTDLLNCIKENHNFVTESFSEFVFLS